MKRIIVVVSLFVFTFFLTGCSNNSNSISITYTKFSEVFNNKADYNLINQTIKYEDSYERFLEASGKDIQFLYYEFKTEDDAKKYLKDNYKHRKKYKYKNRNGSITVKCTSGMYFYAVQNGKTVVIGDSPNKKNKKEIQKIFKELEK